MKNSKANKVKVFFCSLKVNKLILNHCDVMSRWFLRHLLVF